jgi:hypothetical protein
MTASLVFRMEKEVVFVKRWVSLLLALAILQGGAGMAAADTNVRVDIDHQRQVYPQPPVLLDGTTLVPFRNIFETLGAKVQWEEATQTVTATKGRTHIVLQIGSSLAYKNDTAVTLHQSPRLLNGYTMVPLRFVSEALGGEVKWDGAQQTVMIRSAELAMIDAIRAGQVDGLDAFLSAGADPNYLSYEDLTPLLAAVGNDSAEQVHQLLAAGSDVNGPNRDGMFPLMEALIDRREKAFAALLQAKADLNLICEKIAMTPLMYAVFTGRSDAVRALLDAGASVSVKNAYGYTALKFAQQQSEEDILRMLRDAGATE